MKRSSIRELALVLAGFALLACAMTYPLARHPASLVYKIQTNFDAQFSVWNVAWVAHALGTNPLHLFDANIFYPHRWALAYSEANLGAGALAFPVYWTTRSPYAAHNAVILLSFVLSGASMYYLARYLAGDRRAAAIAGICFAFCPHVFGHLPHVQLLMTWGLPLSLLAFHRLADAPTLGRGAQLGLVMGAQTYCCEYYGVFVMLLIGYASIFTAVSGRRWRDLPFWRSTAAAALVAIALTLPLAVVYATIQQATGFRRTLADAASFSADWSAYLASSAYAHAWMLAHLSRWADVLFPGFVALGFGVAGAWLGLTARGRSRALTLLYVSIACIAFWESFGPRAGLYRVTYALVPGFSFLRAATRFGLIVVLALCVLGARAIARLLANVSAPNLVATLIAIVAVGELATPLRLEAVPQPDPAYERLASLPRGALLELPIYSERFAYVRTRYMLGSTVHWMPLVDAYSDYIPPDFRDHADTLASFPDAGSIKELRREGVRYALVHVSDYKGEMRTTLERDEKAFAGELRPLYVGENVHLYEVTGVQ